MVTMRSIWEDIRSWKEVRKETGLQIAALLDTKGPEIRTGVLVDGKKVTLEQGQTYV